MKNPFSKHHLVAILVAIDAVSCRAVEVAQAKLTVPPSNNSPIASNTTRLPEGIVRYHYLQHDYTTVNAHATDNLVEDCTTVLILGVGTTLQVQDYDLVASSIARQTPGLVVLVVDHAPGNPLKTSATRYTALVQALDQSLHTVVPLCDRDLHNDNNNNNNKAISNNESTNQPPTRQYLIGGHSASGQAAIQALVYLMDSPLQTSLLGVVGLSPFRLTPYMPAITIPTLFWGFSHFTCGVDIAHAADQGYQSSPTQTRVLYQLQNPWGHPNHCVFTDRGCGLVCPMPNPNHFEWVHGAVGASIHQFIMSLQNHTFTRDALTLPANASEHVLMFLKDDKLPTPTRSNSTETMLLQ